MVRGNTVQFSRGESRTRALNHHVGHSTQLMRNGSRSRHTSIILLDFGPNMLQSIKLGPYACCVSHFLRKVYGLFGMQLLPNRRNCYPL